MDAAILSSLVRPGIVVSSGGEAGGGGTLMSKRYQGAVKEIFLIFGVSCFLCFLFFSCEI